MAGKFYRLIHHTPLIKKQDYDDEFIRLTLPIALHALLTTYIFFMILIFSTVNTLILPEIQQEATFVDRMLSYPLISIIFAVLVASSIVIVIDSQHQLLRDRTFKEEYYYVKTSFMEGAAYEFENMNESQLEHKIAIDLQIDLLKVYLIGILSGIYSLIFYFLITYTIYIFLLAVILNFASIPATATLASLFATALTVMRITQVKTNIIEPEKPEIDPHADYEPSMRQIEIINSNLPPIICPACRSYISANSKICRVCGEDVTSEPTV